MWALFLCTLYVCTSVWGHVNNMRQNDHQEATLKREERGAREALEGALTDTNAAVYIISSPNEKRTAHVKAFVEVMGLASRTEYHEQVEKQKFLQVSPVAKSLRHACACDVLVVCSVGWF